MGIKQNHLDKINNRHVKICPKCKTKFTLDQLFYDPDIIPIGICFEESMPGLNCYFFNHEIDSCKTTFTVMVEAFSKFIQEDIPEAELIETSKCEGRCLRIDDQDDCSQNCHFAPYRSLLTKMREAKESRYMAPKIAL